MNIFGHSIVWICWYKYIRIFVCVEIFTNVTLCVKCNLTREREFANLQMTSSTIHHVHQLATFFNLNHFHTPIFVTFDKANPNCVNQPLAHAYHSKQCVLARYCNRHCCKFQFSIFQYYVTNLCVTFILSLLPAIFGKTNWSNCNAV